MSQDSKWFLGKPEQQPTMYDIVNILSFANRANVNIKSLLLDQQTFQSITGDLEKEICSINGPRGVVTLWYDKKEKP